MLKISGVVVQLVRMPACHAGGRGFESRPFRETSVKSWGFFVYEMLCIYHRIPGRRYFLHRCIFRSGEKTGKT